MKIIALICYLLLISSTHAQLITTLPGSVGGGGGGGGPLVPWGSTCNTSHQNAYGSKSIVCPSGWCQDNSTCGCSPCGGPPVCAICSSSSICPIGTTCEMPSGCQSLICVSSGAVALSISKARFTLNGLKHDGAVLCDVNSGATLLNLDEKLKDETCRKIYQALKKVEEYYP